MIYLVLHTWTIALRQWHYQPPPLPTYGSLAVRTQALFPYIGLFLLPLRNLWGDGPTHWFGLGGGDFLLGSRGMKKDPPPSVGVSPIGEEREEERAKAGQVYPTAKAPLLADLLSGRNNEPTPPLTSPKLFPSFSPGSYN